VIDGVRDRERHRLPALRAPGEQVVLSVDQFDKHLVHARFHHLIPKRKIFVLQANPVFAARRSARDERT